MSEVGKLLIETITDSDPAIRDRSARELVAASTLAEKIEACACSSGFAGHDKTSTSASVPRFFSMPSTVTRSRTTRRSAPRATSRFPASST